MSSSRLPDFIFIGPDKAGSSWLYEILKAHSRCFVPEAKDIYFFDRYYQRGLDWYARFFAPAPPSTLAAGELSHDYLFSPTVARRIASDIPGVRIITSVRSPAERTFSHYLYLVRSGLTTDPFERALERFPELIDHSLYGKHLEPYLELFPREALCVLDFDQLRRDPEGYACTLFKHLGVPFEEDLPYRERVLPASRAKSVLVARAAKAGANLVRDLGLANIVGVVKRSWLSRMLYTPYAVGNAPRMSTETERLLMDRFGPDIKRLRAITGLELPSWHLGD